MPAPANADEFLDFVRKSGVAEEVRLKSSLQRITEQGGIPKEPQELAKLLMRDGVLTFFQADQLLQGKWKRFFIGKYKVLERLGSGGMGQVFLCEHKLMRRRVALKVLPAAKADDPSALERFYREARAVAALDHPNIVRAYDIDQDEKLHFLVMEYVDGTNLQDLVKKHGVLDPIRACHYIYGAAVGLQHAHEMGLVHRDIKPGNILIDRTGVVKILDMGLARFFHDEEDLLTKKYDENILGTADYLAPEQAIDSHSVDIRADIYSLGATFYYLLSGQPPFPEGTVAQKLLWHQTREPMSLHQLRAELPQPIVDVVVRMMAKDAKARYQIPGEVMTALAPWVQTPIPPPAEAEMPILSPALMTGMTGPLTTKLPSGSPSVVAAPPPAQIGPSPSSAHTPNTSETTSQAITSPPPQVVPQTPLYATVPVVGVSPAETASIVPTPAQSDPWQSFTDTISNEFAAPVEAKQASPPKSAKPSKRLWIGLIAGILTLGLIGGGAGLAYFLWNKPTNAALGKIWYVSTNPSSSPDSKRTLTTLRGAVEQAGIDETILILEPRLEEPPFRIIDSQGKKKGLKIEAGTPAKQVIWSPKLVGSTGARTAFELIDIENANINGLVLELSPAFESGMTIQGSCTGTTVSEVIVKNCRVAGIRLQNVTGDVNRPLTIQHCRVASENKIDAGIQVLGFARGVHFLGNRLETPGGASFKAEAQLRDVEFRGNRLYNADHGLWLSGKPMPDAAYTLKVSQNTFHTINTAAIFCDLPLKEPKQLVQVNQNYFAACKVVCSAEVAKSGIKFTTNAKDAISTEGPLNSESAVVLSTIPTPNPNDDRGFLRPASPLLHPNGLPLGAPEK